MRAIQRFGKQLQRLRTRRDRWPVAHVRDAAGTGTARPFVEHAGAIGEGAEGVGDGVVRRDHECETVVAGGRGSLCDARGCRGSRPHLERDVCRTVSEQTRRPRTPSPPCSRDEVITAQKIKVVGSLFCRSEMIFPSSLVTSFLWSGTHVGPNAPVERGPSEGARSGSTGPTWVSFHFSRLRSSPCKE